ncbi:MAG TPA: sugar phosphate nucleotidyltransferase [Candidatus Sulfotelmatobacter sp.]|nr:sugar phosphate nucleotidyltransferase [Candidatus Sulfotelmatobacter sp.]
MIPAAGLGTRLLSVTKEQPKEMLPVFAKAKNGDLCLKPIVQLVFEQLHQVGFREFCFIVGRGKRAIEDHFTPDFSYVSMLDSKGLDGPAEELEAFYKMIDGSTVSWVNQSQPRGFGDAVLKARSFVGSDGFLVHAGDSHFISKNAEHLRRVVLMSEESKADALFLSMEVEDPSRFGIVEGEPMANGLVKVKRLVEKPAKPASKLAIMPVYAFSSNIFKALEATKAGFAGELQLTDGIQQMVDWDLNVYTTRVASSEIWLDIGSPDLFWEAQNLSHKYFSAQLTSLSQPRF